MSQTRFNMSTCNSNSRSEKRPRYTFRFAFEQTSFSRSLYIQKKKFCYGFPNIQTFCSQRFEKHLMFVCKKKNGSPVDSLFCFVLRFDLFFLHSLEISFLLVRFFKNQLCFHLFVSLDQFRSVCAHFHQALGTFKLVGFLGCFCVFAFFV